MWREMCEADGAENMCFKRLNDYFNKFMGAPFGQCEPSFSMLETFPFLLFDRMSPAHKLAAVIEMNVHVQSRTFDIVIVASIRCNLGTYVNFVC